MVFSRNREERKLTVSDRLTPLALAVLASTYGGTAQAQETQAGYEVSKSQTVQKAPEGYVGRKTTDRETRVGNTPETDGNSTTFVMTLGGFVRRCPTAEGIAAGTYEYSLVSDQVDTDHGETQRSHYVHRMLATLEGHVRDDAKLDHVDLEADFTEARPGAPTQHQHLRTSFRPGEGAGGAPNMDDVQHAVEVTANFSVATVIWFASTIYHEALLEWNKEGECVEFAFDPPSESRALGPNATAEVHAVLRTKEEKAAVGGGKFQANSLLGIGTLTPHGGETRADAPSVFRYTATAKPKKGDGFDVGTLSRAGFGSGKWKIGPPELLLTFALTLTQRAEDVASEFRIALPKTSLLADSNGVYRGTGQVMSKGAFRGGECALEADFPSTIKIAARAEDPEHTRFRLQFIANEPTHPAEMKCPEFSRSVPLPFETWIKGPTVKPAVLGQVTPVNGVLNVQGLTATVTGPVTLSLPPEK
jgi:hypothetical protein